MNNIKDFPEFWLDADWIISNAHTMFVTELNKTKEYWFNRWNFETGDPKDQEAYEAIQRELDRGDYWNVNQVTNMANMFASCSSINTIDISAWNNLENIDA